MLSGFFSTSIDSRSSFCFSSSVSTLFILFILTLAAAESAVALALIMAYYRIYGNIIIDLNINELSLNKKY